jgi:tRNA(fMet)-specific endonuclease VapC
MTAAYLLDTNTVSYHIANQPSQVRRKLDAVGLSAVAISAVTEAELRYGVARNPGAMRRRASVESFLANAAILPWDSVAAQAYGLLRAEQERKGRPLSAEDLMIAAHALSLDLVLITNDQAFRFVEGLKTRDWTVP